MSLILNKPSIKPLKHHLYNEEGNWSYTSPLTHHVVPEPQYTYVINDFYGTKEQIPGGIREYLAVRS
jgi:hypothetical protein